MARILVVDDQESFLTLLTALLTANGYQVVGLTTGQAAIEAMEREPFDLVICDIFMQPMNGMKVLLWLHERMPLVPVVMLTGHGTVETARQALKLGAFDYITKPFEMADVLWSVERALLAPERPPEIQYAGDGLVANSPGIQTTIKALRRLAPTPLPVLITGESGSGKSELAARMPRWSGRETSPFLLLRCADLNDGTEREDGHTEGDGSTGGLDEIGACTLGLVDVEMLPVAYQRELLNLLQRHAHAGPGAPIPRIVAMTTVNMDRYVEQGLFDRDLHALLSRFTVPLAPLRGRREDILPLTYHFMRQQLEGREPPALESDVHGILEHHDWPGNAAELRAVVQTMLTGDVPATLASDRLPAHLRGRVSLAETAPHARASDRGHWLRRFLQQQGEPELTPPQAP